MGTPFISLLEPTSLQWERGVPPGEQPARSSIPRTFLDAMSVRTQVFVEEQKVPAENEYDPDDPRSAHWVIYASVNQTISRAVTDPETGEVIQPRRSETQSVPIGTVRLVPFPHPPHPLSGGVYVDGELVGTTSEQEEKEAEAHGEGGPVAQQAQASNPDQQQQEHRRTSSVPSFTTDRPTDFHDGQEPYVKLGRLAVLMDFRGRGIARQLVLTAVDWMRQNPTYFDPSPAERGFEHLGMEQGGELPRWRGLFCCHAQEDAVKVWERCGFQVDKAMGRWMEEGIPHVGMFLRVDVDRR
jgi:predicted GNAT family N-acyltransferase